MAVPAVAVLDDYQNAARRFGPWERLDRRIALEVFTDHLDGEDALVNRLSNFDVIVAMRERTPLSAALLARLERLRLIVTTGMGNAAIDVDAAREHGVVVSGTQVGGTATAELTWGLVLALTRHIAQEDANIRAGGWQQTIGPELSGRTLGLVGLGVLGTRVAAYGAAFGMRLIAWSQNLDTQHARSAGVEAVEKDALFARSDVVSIHLRLSERTRRVVGARELALMKPTAFLVNTSRGPIVDEAALIEALEHDRIAGAALDVFDHEPLSPGHRLVRAKNTLLTPHLGYVAVDAYEVFYREIVEDIEAWLDGNPIRLLGG